MIKPNFGPLLLINCAPQWHRIIWRFISGRFVPRWPRPSRPVNLVLCCCHNFHSHPICFRLLLCGQTSFHPLPSSPLLSLHQKSCQSHRHCYAMLICLLHRFHQPFLINPLIGRPNAALSAMSQSHVKQALSAIRVPGVLRPLVANQLSSTEEMTLRATCSTLHFTAKSSRWVREASPLGIAAVTLMVKLQGWRPLSFSLSLSLYYLWLLLLENWPRFIARSRSLLGHQNTPRRFQDFGLDVESCYHYVVSVRLMFALSKNEMITCRGRLLSEGLNRKL